MRRPTRLAPDDRLVVEFALLCWPIRKLRQHIGWSIRALVPRVAVALATASLVYAPSPAVSQPMVAPVPDWVVMRQLPPPDGQITRANCGSSCVLLVDCQNHYGLKTRYYHTATKMLSSDGVQELSDLQVDYDPSYEKLTLHTLVLHRDGITIDKLGQDSVEIIQREEGMERFLYDGSMTAIIHVSDVRVGDIIEVAYSREGWNPIYGEHIFGHFATQFFMPVEQYAVRLLVPDEQFVNFQFSKRAPRPDIRREAGCTVYEWLLEKPEELVYEDNVPAWHIQSPMVRFTDFADWSEMVEWALPLFEVSESERARLRTLMFEELPLASGPRGILPLIRFVQKDIRYLSLSEGMSAYRPHAPSQVWKQRYGDCKDKALLLSTLLNEIGVEAYPVLVNTAGPRSVEDLLVAPTAFDHCVVAFLYDGELRVVDPTASQQGGSVENIHVDDYGYGLIVSSGRDHLVRLPTNSPGRTSIRETFVFDGEGNTSFLVNTVYMGADADVTRRLFATMSHTDIQQYYLSVYAIVFPGIGVAAELAFKDVHRDSENIVEVDESYVIKDIWGPSEEDTNAVVAEFYPLELLSETAWRAKPGRTAPYYVGQADYRYEAIIDPGEPWSIEPDHIAINGNGYEYNGRVAYDGKLIRLTHEYRRTVDHIQAEDVADFVAAHDRIQSALTFQLLKARDGRTLAQASGQNAETRSKGRAGALVLISVMMGVLVVPAGVLFLLWGRKARAELSVSTLASRAWSGLVASRTPVIICLAFNTALYVLDARGYRPEAARRMLSAFPAYVNVALLVVSLWLFCGVVRVAMSAVHAGSWRWKQLLTPVGDFLELAIVGAVALCAIYVSAFFLVVPAILLFLMWSQVGYLILDNKTTGFAALSESKRMTSGTRRELAVVYFVLGCGGLPGLGLLLVWPEIASWGWQLDAVGAYHTLVQVLWIFVGAAIYEALLKIDGKASLQEVVDASCEPGEAAVCATQKGSV
jgi:hypothetical protein